MFVHTYYGVGGNTTVMNQLCQGLNELGHKTAIGAFNFQQKPPSGINMVKLNRIGKLLPKVYEDEFDIIHSHQTLANYSSLFTSKDFIFHYHGAATLLQKLNLKFSMLLCKHKIKKIISVSKTGVKQLNQILGKIHADVIYNGVSTDFFCPGLTTPFKIGSPQLLFVGNLYPKKNVGLLLEFITKLLPIYPKIHLQIVGSGPEFEKLSNLMKDLSLEKNVQLVGRIDNEELRLRYSSCDFYISASQFEVHPVPIMESLSSGKPVFLSDISPHEEILDLSNSGMLFSVNDLEKAIDNFSELIDKKESFSKNARSFALNYDWKKVCERLSNIYESL